MTYPVCIIYIYIWAQRKCRKFKYAESVACNLTASLHSILNNI